MNGRRFVVAVFGALVASVALYIAYRFVAALTVAVFIYYSTRRFHRSLAYLRLPKRLRAMVTLSTFAIPLLLLLGYTMVLLVVEVRSILDEYPVFDMASVYIDGLDDVEEIPDLTIDGIITAYQNGELDPFIDVATNHADEITALLASFLVNLLIVVVVTYYLLVDGTRAHNWLLTFDDDSMVREYLKAADKELEAVLFGNLLNVIIISLFAVVVYMGYNALAPGIGEVPYPALAGALTGIASLIPVIGMKIVYVPLAGAAASPVAMDGAPPETLLYVGGFLVLVIIFVDTIPDLFLRPYLSGKRTHVGLLMLAYIFGPIVFGFYGLFLAPIILVLGLTFAQTALPRLLGAEPEDDEIPQKQATLDEF